MKRLLVLLIIVLVCISVFAGCSGGASSPTISVATQPVQTTTTATTQPVQSTTTTSGVQPQSGGTFKLLVPVGSPGPFGWVLDATFTHVWVVPFVWAEPLIYLHEDNTVDPWLAESWEFSKDYMSVTFALRKGVKFHDGTTFNADAVKFILDANIEAKKACAANWKSVEIIDDFHVRLNFSKYQNTLWGDLSNTSCMMISPTQVREKGKEYANLHPVGTGPFKFVSYTQDVNAKFERYNDYWKEGTTYLDAIEVIPIKDANTIEAALQSGAGHAIAMQDGMTMSNMKKKGYQIIAPLGGTFFVVPDGVSENSPFVKQQVREAVEYAINKEAVVQALGFGYMMVDSQLAFNTHPYYVSEIPQEGRGYNPDKAKQLLAEAGYPNGFKTSLVTQPIYKSQTEMYQQFLSEVGIEADIEMLDNAAWYGVNSQGWPGKLFVGAASFGPNFAQQFQAQFYPPYYTSLKKPANLEQTVTAALSEPDPVKQKELNQSIIKMIYDEADIIVVHSAALGFILSPKVHGGVWAKGASSLNWEPRTIWLEK